MEFSGKTDSVGRVSTLSLILTLVLVALIALPGAAFAQEAAAHPMFRVLPPHNLYPGVNNEAPAAQLPQWTFNWTSSFNHRNFSSVIIGTDPSQTNTTTTVTVAVIPIKMVYGSTNGNMTFDPTTNYFPGVSTVQMVMGSPIFKSAVDYVQGGVDLGKTQYIDAYQRGNFWSDVASNTNYHVLLKAVTATSLTQTFTVPKSEGNVISNPWSGISTGTADINWFDSQLQGVITKLKIPANVLPLFLTYNVYLTEFGECCIGGYHSANGPAPSGLTYSYSTQISQATVPVFSQDIGALSHEIGEWLMDPFTTNASPCPSNSILEVGDPLETDTNPEFGDYPYKVGAFTYHPQDLVFISWFGAPASTGVDNWVTFQGQKLNVCQTGS